MLTSQSVLKIDKLTAQSLYIDYLIAIHRVNPRDISFREYLTQLFPMDHMRFLIQGKSQLEAMLFDREEDKVIFLLKYGEILQDAMQ